MEKKIQIYKTPKINKTQYRKFKTEDKILQEIVDNFTFVLENNIQKENLQLFYNNISTLKVENRRIILETVLGLFKDNTITGMYYLDDNTISVLPLRSKNFLSKYIGTNTEEYITNICHELFHMSTTNIDKEKNIIFSGFAQIGKNNIGIAIDDAYTEILLFRYFNLNREYMSYEYEVAITSLIEELVGDMTILYFNANLYGLVEELQQYSTREAIIKFIEDLDSVYVLNDHSKKYQKDIIYYHNEISKFLVSTYINKLNSDIRKDKISDIEYNMKLDIFIDKIHNAFKKLEVDKKKTKIRNNSK